MLAAYTLPPNPAPPETTNAPESVDVLDEVLRIVIDAVVIDPLLATVSNVEVFQTTITPVLVLTAVYLPQ
jgi:hypothetical protein